MTRENDFKYISGFAIGEFNEFSDHAPIMFSLCSKVNEQLNTFTRV
jgi:hypothetical protein